MDELLTFSSLADAMAKGRNAVKSIFTVEEGAEGNEEERNYDMISTPTGLPRLSPSLGGWLHSLQPVTRLRG